MVYFVHQSSTERGFEVNPYDRCVANKVISGKQCTMVWYVDDNLLSHVDSTVVDDVLKIIEGHFPGLAIERGRKLNFLGIKLDFFTKGKLKLGMVHNITNMIEELEEELKPFGKNIDHMYPHPAARWLFTTKDNSPKPAEIKADIYRKYVTKNIWVMKRSRPDIEPPISFLCI